MDRYQYLILVLFASVLVTLTIQLWARQAAAIRPDRPST